MAVAADLAIRWRARDRSGCVKRLRWYLEREPQALSAVLQTILRAIKRHLRPASDAGAHVCLRVVSFIHPVGSSLNRRVHYDENHPGFRASRALSGTQIRSRRNGHCCVIDEVFEPLEAAPGRGEGIRFRRSAPLTPEAVATSTVQIRMRMLRWFTNRGSIDVDDVREMIAGENSGISPDAPTCVSAKDRAGVRRFPRMGIPTAHAWKASTPLRCKS